MRRTTISVLLGSLALFSHAAPAQPAAPDAPPAEEQQAKKPETIRASRSIEVNGRVPNGELFDAMCRRAITEHAGILGGLPAAPEVDLVTMAKPDRGGGGLFGDTTTRRELLEMTVDLRRPRLRDAQPRAAEFLDAFITSLDWQLREWQAEEAGVPAAERDVERATALLDERRAEFRQLEQQIRQTTGRADASVDAIRSSVPKLDEERQSLKLQVIGKAARQAALAATIERLAKAAGERAGDDPVAAELEKVVAVRERAVEHARELQKAASISTQEVAEAEAVLAEARARLLERRDAVARANGGELLEALNRELATLSIDAAESQAKLAALDALLAKYVDAEELLARAVEVRQDRERHVSDLRDAQARLQTARSSLPDRVLQVVEAEDNAPNDPRLEQPAAGVKGHETDGDSPPEQ